MTKHKKLKSKSRKSKDTKAKVSPTVVVLICCMVVASVWRLNTMNAREPIDNIDTNQNSFVITPQTPKSEPVVLTDVKAKFLVYINGEYRIFSGAMYQNQSPDVFIPANDTFAVQVTKQNTTWSNFFNTLPFKLDNNCIVTGEGQNFCNNSSSTLKFYINGISTPDALTRIISNLDRLLITYGPENPAETARQLEVLKSL